MTKLQYERISSNAELKGFSSLSSYLRYVALEHDFKLYEKVAELHAFLLGETRRKRRKNNEVPLM